MVMCKSSIKGLHALGNMDEQSCMKSCILAAAAREQRRFELPVRLITSS